MTDSILIEHYRSPTTSVYSGAMKGDEHLNLSDTTSDISPIIQSQDHSNHPNHSNHSNDSVIAIGVPPDIPIPQNRAANLSGLSVLKYSDQIMKNRKALIKVTRPTYLYDPKEKEFFSMSNVSASICSYKGVNKLLEDLKRTDPTLYVLAPMYARTRGRRFSRGKPISKTTPDSKLIASLHSRNNCNAGDIQPLFGGKLKKTESEIDGVLREIEEESTFIFEKGVINRHSSTDTKGKISVCFHSSVTNIVIGTANAKVSQKDERSDDPKRKVCMAIHGSAQDIANRLIVIPEDSKFDDNIIAMAILPIEVAIAIDDYSVRTLQEGCKPKNLPCHVRK